MRDESSLAIHELRAPLTVAEGYLSLLIDGSLGPGPSAWSEALEIVAEKLATANLLVNDLLLLGQLNSGRDELRLQDLDLVGVAGAACDRAKGRAEQIGATFTLEADQAEVRALADERMVAILIDNLLNNALNYGGSEPPVIIRVGRSPEPYISITDHGVGISRQQQSMLFTRFGRLVTPETSHIRGTGLGLYLAREIARLHGGDIVVRSNLGRGTTFTVTLPLASASPGPRAADTAASPSPS